MTPRYASLASRIQTTLGDVATLVQRAETLALRARTQGDDGYWDGVALNLHGFYCGIEQVLQDIARTVDDCLPEGREWHRDLLLQMAAPMPGVRPAVLEPETRHALDGYRGFRHVVRNVYTFQLQPARLQELVDGMRPCLQLVRHDLERFLVFLQTHTSSSQTTP